MKVGKMVTPDDYALPTTTTPGEAERVEVDSILKLIDTKSGGVTLGEYDAKNAVSTLVQVLVSNGMLTLDQVKRTLE